MAVIMGNGISGLKTLQITYLYNACIQQQVKTVKYHFYGYGEGGENNKVGLKQ